MNSGNRAVLIIDDDTRNIFALSAVLKSRGFLAIPAGGMSEAFEKLSAPNNIGVILLDMMMPDMDGYQALEIFKSNEAFRHLSVIAVTAQAMPGDREKCLAAGADEYIPKPIDVELLFQTLMHIA